MQKPKLLVIVGPTASGKSALAVSLARRFAGELVSADSRQVYRGMDVATAKLEPPRGIRQWLVDIVEPNEPFTVAQYQRHARRAIAAIHERQHLPILVGGTALYVDAVAHNWLLPKVSPQARLRRSFAKRVERSGLGALIEELNEIDPDARASIDTNNPRRVLRALEIAKAGLRWTNVARSKGQPRYDVLKIGKAVDTDMLRAKIHRRIGAMFRHGLERETRRLIRRYPLTAPALSGIGYFEVNEYLQGRLTRKECVDRIANRTYRYAKRQMTWWKRDKEIRWVTTSRAAERLVRAWLAR